MPPERCYVYGIVGSSPEPELDVPGGGLRAAPVTAVECGPVMAVISRLDGARVRPSRADLSAHQRVVEHVASSTTILPMQFGVCWMSEEALLDEFLKPNCDNLLETLGAFEGRHEHRLKASYRGDTALREAVATSPTIRRLRQQIRRSGPAASYGSRIELGELVSGQIDRIRAADTAAIMGRLDEHALSSVMLAGRRDDIVVHAGFLIDGHRQDQFDRALDRLAADLGDRMSFELVGPLPPWDFVATGPDPTTDTQARRSL